MIIKKPNRAGILEYYQDNQPPSKSKLRCPLEKHEQINLNSFCLHRWPVESEMMFHVQNESGASGSGHYGAMLNKMGRKKGVPDWLVMIPSNGYHGLYIELKREFKKDSSLGKEQKKFLLHAQSIGYQCVIAYGYKAALEAIKDYFAESVAI